MINNLSFRSFWIKWMAKCFPPKKLLRLNLFHGFFLNMCFWVCVVFGCTHAVVCSLCRTNFLIWLMNKSNFPPYHVAKKEPPKILNKCICRWREEESEREWTKGRKNEREGRADVLTASSHKSSHKWRNSGVLRAKYVDCCCFGRFQILQA